jgi:hypothetical protein
VAITSEEEKENCCIDGPIIALLVTTKIPAKLSAYQILSVIVVLLILVFKVLLVNVIPKRHTSF